MANIAAKQEVGSFDTNRAPGPVTAVPQPADPGRSPDSAPTARPELMPLLKQLEQRRDELVSQGKEMRTRLDEQVLDSPGDVGDVSVLDASTDFYMNRVEHQHAELAQIADALDRLHRGVYGVCESCENDILVERLQKLPYARFCIDCQSAVEAGRHTRGIRSSTKL